MAGPTRLVALRRIARLYGTVERMHAVTLRRASASVNEADIAIGLARGMTKAANLAGREALEVGDRGEWMISESQLEVAALRRSRLEKLRDQREILLQAARLEFQASRVRTEQMNQVVADMRMRAAVEDARRIQAASDDRFLTRMRWRTARVERE